MYCSNCGREGKEGELFCGGCGLPKGLKVSEQSVQTLPVEQVSVQHTNIPEEQPKKKMPTWAMVLLITLGVIGILVLAFIGFFVFVVIAFSNYEEEIYAQTDSYVYVDEDEVPTVYELIGEFEMCDYPDYEYYDGVEYTTYSYCDDYLDEDKLNNYLDYLVEDYGFEEYDESSSFRSIMIESVDEGYIIVVKAYLYGEFIEYYKIQDDRIEEDNDI